MTRTTVDANAPTPWVGRRVSTGWRSQVSGHEFEELEICLVVLKQIFQRKLPIGLVYVCIVRQEDAVLLDCRMKRKSVTKHIDSNLHILSRIGFIRHRRNLLCEYVHQMLPGIPSIPLRVCSHWRAKRRWRQNLIPKGRWKLARFVRIDYRAPKRTREESWRRVASASLA